MLVPLNMTEFTLYMGANVDIVTPLLLFPDLSYHPVMDVPGVGSITPSFASGSWASSHTIGELLEKITGKLTDGEYTVGARAVYGCTEGRVTPHFQAR